MRPCLALTLALAVTVAGCLAGEERLNVAPDGGFGTADGVAKADGGRTSGDGPASATADGGRPADGGVAPKPECSIAPWAPGVAYGAGQVVEWHVAYFECLQSHVSQSGWEPDTTPALWL